MKSEIIEELLLYIAEPCHIKRLNKVMRWINKWAEELNLTKKENANILTYEHISKVHKKYRDKT